MKTRAGHPLCKKKTAPLRQIFLAFLFVASVAHADPIADPFRPSGIMPSGKHAGKKLLIDETGSPSVEVKRRSFRLLTAAEAEKVIPAEVVRAAATRDVSFIANVSHDGDFWVGIFENKNAIESINFQIERFPPEWIAAHTEIRFNMAPGHEIPIYSQTRPDKPSVKLKSFITTVEGVPMDGGPKFNLFDALRDSFGLAKRIVSLEDKVRIVVFHELNTVYQYRLNFNSAQRDAFWATALEFLHDPEMKQIYHLLRKNCTNVLFELFDHFLERKRGLFAKVATALPISADRSLRHRGVLDLKTTLDTLNKEFNGPSRKMACKNLIDPV